MTHLLALMPLIAMVASPPMRAQPESIQARQQRLGDLATFRADTSSDELRAVFASGIEDPESRVRETALLSLAGRVSFAAANPSQDRLAQWRADREALLALRSSVFAALKDQVGYVRAAAAIALVHLMEDSPPPRQQLRVSDETVRVLYDAYKWEPAAFNRGELIKHIAINIDRASPLVREVLFNALSDGHESVVAHALTGLGNARIEASLPQIATHLAHASRAVRLNAAGALSRFGSAARPYRELVQAAAARESDFVVRQTLEALAKTLK